MFFVIPIRVKRRRGSPTASALMFAIFGLVFAGIGVVTLASGASCDGHEMREGDRCVYREEGKTEADHTNTKAEEERSNLYTGLGALAFGIAGLAYAPFIYRKVERNNAQLARAQRAHAPGGGRPPAVSPMQSAYAAQVANHAAYRRQPAPPPLPPAAPPPPAVHHDL